MFDQVCLKITSIFVFDQKVVLQHFAAFIQIITVLGFPGYIVPFILVVSCPVITISLIAVCIMPGLIDIFIQSIGLDIQFLYHVSRMLKFILKFLAVHIRIISQSFLTSYLILKMNFVFLQSFSLHNELRVYLSEKSDTSE